MTSPRSLSLAALLVVACGATERSGWRLEHEIEPGDHPVDLAVDGDTLLVSAETYHDDGGVDYGAGHVFKRQGSSWRQVHVLRRPGGDHTPYIFGVWVAIEGDTAVISGEHAFEVLSDPRRAYVFQRDGASWAHTQTLLPEDQERPYGGLGDISISGNTLLAAGAAIETTDSRSAYVYVREDREASWVVQQKLVLGESSPADLRVTHVSLDGELALIEGRPVDGSTMPVAYVFERRGSSWTQQAKLEGEEGAGYLSVSISGEAALLSGGQLYERRGASWIQTAELLPEPRPDPAMFSDVALAGDVAVVSFRSYVSPDGYASVFERSAAGWHQTATLASDDAIPMGNVATDGDTIAVVVGEWDDVGDVVNGRVQIYRRR